MFNTPPRREIDMVSTRSAVKKEERRIALEKDAQQDGASNEVVETNEARNQMYDQPGPSTAQNIRHSSQKRSSTSSISALKKRLELEAAQAKAKIQIELIEKKLEADIAELEDEGSLHSEKCMCESNEQVVEKWLENSQQELQKPQCATNVPPPAPQASSLHRLTAAGPPPPAAENMFQAYPPTATAAIRGTDDTIQALASAVKDLAAASAGRGTDDRMLNRLCTPRELPKYSGDPLEWLQFRQAYEESSQVCNFTDKENLWRLRRSLHGPAKEAVTSLLIGATSANDVMATLELQFGNPDVIVSKILQDLYKLRPIPQEYQREIIPFSVKVRNCVAAITAIGQDEYLKGINLVSVIISKLPIMLISKWTDYSYLHLHNKEKPKLLLMSEFLSEEAKKISTMSVNLPIVFGKQSEYKHRDRTLLLNCEDEIVNKSDEKCRYCRISKHNLQDCKKFKKSLRRDRWTYVKRQGMCFKCLSGKHKQDSCPAPVCDVDMCGLPHHRLLHYVIKKNLVPCENVNITDVTESETGTGTETESCTDNQRVEVEKVNHLNMNNRKVLLKTVPIYLHGPNGVYRCVALLDGGSTVSLICAELASKAGLRGKQYNMHVSSAWNNSEIMCRSEILNLELSTYTGAKFSISARSVNNMNLPKQNVTDLDLSSYELKPEIKNYVISDGQCKPEILIGQDNYELLLPLECIRATPSGPFFTRTPLGWCVHGRVPCETAARRIETHSTLFISEKEDTECERILREIQDEVRQSFAIEAAGISSKPRENKLDVQAVECLQKTATFRDGRWYVGLPWKGMFGVMPNSYDTALIRLRGIDKKMRMNPGFAARYQERVDHLFNNDYASELKQTVSPNRIWYLPHFGVDNPNKKKMRLVFDAAAKTQGLCLNDFLLKGPDLLVSLYGMMLRFREHKIAMTGDIKDMFLRTKIIEEDRDALRFLWKNSTYVMTSLIFGANCSPFVAQFIKNKNAERFLKSHPAAVRAILDQHYADDYIDSVSDEDTAIQLVNDVTYIHKQGGFEMRNWTSNVQNVLRDLPNENRQSTPVSFKCGQQYEGERTLGLIWNTEDDTLGFDVSFKKIPIEIISGQKRPTKREMLRVLMSIFDVYGFLSPITIKGKIILQDTWRSAIKWDEKLPDRIFLKWTEWINNMKNIDKIRLPRHYESAARGACMGTARVSETAYAAGSSARELNNSPQPTYTNLELHIFCDASTRAMCAVAFWRWIDTMRCVRVAFVSSKTRVAPVKPVSVPRLELQAAVIAARMAETIIKEHRIKPKRKIFWCDSSTVLAWIRNSERTYKQFIAHRLGEIDELTNTYDWRYIPTRLNIADIATRESCEIKMLQNEWFNGPSFLYEDEPTWPTESVSQKPEVHDEDLELVNTIQATHVSLPVVPEPERFSSWIRLVRSTYYMLCFIARCRKAPGACAEGATMERAENLLLKYSQMKAFPDDLHNLQQNKRLEKKSKLLTLSPVLGDDGLIRLAGRIDAAPEIPTCVKRPVILDGRCHIAHLIIKYFHQKAYHGNQELVVNNLKQKYWIIKLRPTVKYISSKCMLCRIRKAQPAPPRMGDLPEARLAHHQRPFTFTGVDLFGPLEVTVGRRKEKRYGVIFTCLTVRAVHIEIVNQLTTDALIMALRRMAARRGWPRHLYSDNGTNLKGADTELKRCVLELDENKLKEGASTYSMVTTWTFIPAASPHWGGAWERLIRNIKTALRVTLNERAPRDETLQTLLAEIEQMVNSRPLTHVAVEPTSNETLTPNHFLLGTSSNLPTLGTFDESDTYLRKQWRLAQRYADMFWKRWVREILPEMRPRKKWHEEQRPLQVGDLVLIVDPSSPRNIWPKGLIHNVLAGKDGRIRVVDVKTKTGLLRRNATRVARIAIDDECCPSTRGGDVGDAYVMF